MNSLKIFLVLLFCLFAFSCGDESILTGGPFIIEGTATMFVGPSTPEFSGKITYILADCFWVTQGKWNDIELYIDNPANLPGNRRRIKVVGNVYKDSSYPYHYMIHISSFKIIDAKTIPNK